MKPILFNTEMVKAILEGRKTVTRRIIKKSENDWNFLELTNNAAITKVNAAGEEYPFDVDGLWATFECDYDPHYPMVKSPYEIGDTIYIRETWCIQSAHRFECDAKIAYKAGGELNKIQFCNRKDYDDFVFNKRIGDGRWYPSIHMPKEAARIFLRVNNVHVERLQQITNEDVCREGVTPKWYAGGCKCSAYESECMNEPCENRAAYERMCYETSFLELWDSTIKPSDICKYGWDANPYVWVIEFERCDKPEA